MGKSNTRSIEQKVLRFIREYNLIDEGDAILVALSGGSDSVGLLLILHKLRDLLGISLAAAHIHHGLRGADADEDQEFCRALCSDLKIPFHTKKVNVSEKAHEMGESFEVAGRKIRYSFFDELINEHQYSKIATGHIISDNTETILLNMFKGTGPSGVRGIPVQRGSVIRPILVLSKNDIQGYLNRRNISFREDKTNEETVYYRNKIRHDIIPVIKEGINPSLDESLLRFSFLQTDMVSYIEEEFLEKMLLEFVTIKQDGFALDLGVFEKVKHILIGELCRICVRKVFHSEFTYEDFRHVLGLEHSQIGTGITISNAIRVVKDRDSIQFSKFSEPEKIHQEFVIGNTIVLKQGKLTVTNETIDRAELSNNPNIEYLDAENIVLPLVIRTWKEGDSFVPIGMKGRKKVSDFLTDTKIPVREKQNQLVITDQKEILWVVGKRMNNNYRMKKTSKLIIKCKWEPNAGESCSRR